MTTTVPTILAEVYAMGAELAVTESAALVIITRPELPAPPDMLAALGAHQHELINHVLTTITNPPLIPQAELAPPQTVIEKHRRQASA